MNQFYFFLDFISLYGGYGEYIMIKAQIDKTDRASILNVLTTLILYFK